MNREEATKLLPIIKAFSEGKEIQLFVGGRWVDTKYITSNYSPQYYRIKPEPTYRSFKDKEECWAEMQKHQPFGWVKTNDNTYRLINLVSEHRIMLGCQNIDWSYEKLFNSFKFYDDAPFGVKVGG